MTWQLTITTPAGTKKPAKRHLKLMSGAALISLLAMLAAPAFANPNGPEYRLGPQDKLRVRVHEWRASKDEVFEWAALKEDYAIGATGALALPLLGEIEASGLTTAELSRAIGDRLKDRLGMIEPPDTTVEVVLYRPFYIIGQVDKPGEYPFRPGLTVLQAISVAGGMQRVSDMGLFRLERDAIVSKGELSQIATESNNLKARKARLEAELKSSAEIDFGKDLLDQKASPLVANLMEQEKRIFEARRKGMTTQLEALAQLKVYLKGEIDSLNAQTEKEDTQIRLVKKELDSVSTLVEKGLSAAPRQLLLQRTIAQIEGERLRLNTNAVKAQQDISKTDIQILDVKNKWANEVNAELRATQASLDQLANRAETSGNLLYEAMVTAPHFIAERARSTRNEPVLKIVRDVEGYPVETVVPDTASVAPGDTIKVEMPQPEAPTLSSAPLKPDAAPALSSTPAPADGRARLAADKQAETTRAP
jgi:protein involved in polysaccharide export with SLBB domain